MFIVRILKKYTAGWLDFIIGCAMIAFFIVALRSFTQSKALVLGSLFMIPMWVFLYRKEVFAYKKIWELQWFLVILAAVISICVLANFSYYESFLDKQILGGTIKHHIIMATDSEGNREENRIAMFVPNDSHQEPFILTIECGLLLLLIGSPLSTFIITKKMVANASPKKNPETNIN